MTILRNATNRTFAASPRGPVRRAFTLMELLVVIGVIALVAAVVVPSISSVFTAGADAQAFNLMTGQVSAARSEALQNGTFAGLHVQLADATANPNLTGTCYTAIFVYQPPNPPGNPQGRFRPARGYLPRRMPGQMAFGEVSPTFLDPSTGDFKAGTMNNPSGFADFTSFTVVFSATGTAVMTMADVGNVVLETTNDLFTGGNKKLWNAGAANDSGSGEPPVTAMTIFDAAEVSKITLAGSDPATYLNKNKQLLPLNVHTGQFFPRQ